MNDYKPATRSALITRRAVFEGKDYVDACDCWHGRAQLIIGFIDDHAEQIAQLLTLEKKRKQHEADESPVVE